MTSILRIAGTALVLLGLLAAPALAKICKQEVVRATSREYVSRSFGAFPGSWSAWRKKVRRIHGDGWQAWRRAERRRINCRQRRDSSGRRRWTCTRAAVPCRPDRTTAGIGRPTTPTGTPGSGNPGACASSLPVDADYVPIREKLALGARGPQVTSLQYLLQQHCYDDVEADGDFGPKTEEAVRAFQRNNKLDVDGIVGPATLDALTGTG